MRTGSGNFRGFCFTFTSIVVLFIRLKRAYIRVMSVSEMASPIIHLETGKIPLDVSVDSVDSP